MISRIFIFLSVAPEENNVGTILTFGFWIKAKIIEILYTKSLDKYNNTDHINEEITEMYFRLLIRKPGPQICCISYRNQSFDLLYKPNDWFLYEMQFRQSYFGVNTQWSIINTAWKESKYGVFSGLYFPVFSPNTGMRTRENSVFTNFSQSEN